MTTDEIRTWIAHASPDAVAAQAPILTARILCDILDELRKITQPAIFQHTRTEAE